MPNEREAERISTSAQKHLKTDSVREKGKLCSSFNIQLENFFPKSWRNKARNIPAI